MKNTNENNCSPPQWLTPLRSYLTNPVFFRDNFGHRFFCHHDANPDFSTTLPNGYGDAHDVITDLGGPANIISPRNDGNPLEKTVDTVQETLLAFHNGWAVAIPDIDLRIPQVGVARDHIAELLGLSPTRIRTGLFLAPPGGGLNYHFDARHIFSIQWIGEKRWTFEPNTQAPYPLENHVRPHRTPQQLSRYVAASFPDHPSAHATTLLVRPGSALYLPLGFWHETQAVTPSVSVSFGVDVPRAVDRWLIVLRQQLLLYPELRNSEPLPTTVKQNPEQVEKTRADQLKILQHVVSRLGTSESGE